VGLVVTYLFLHLPLPSVAWLYDHSLAAPVLAQQARLLPLAWVFSLVIPATIPQALWDLAELDQLSRWDRLRWVLLRPTWSLWLAGWLLLMAVSAGELSTYLLMLPPGVTTVAQRLFELLHFGMRYQDSGLCLVLLLLGWLVAIVSWKTRIGRQ
jgi:iron(III) transport system permease protein